MLERESFGDGWQVSLRASGAARFVVVAFLSVWLCGWAAGEYFAGGTLLAGLRELFAPGLDVPWLPRMTNRAPASPWPVLAFLGVWVAFWTAGGLFAMHEVLRALVGVDHLRWDREGVELVRRAGPFVSRRRLAWAAMEEPLAQRGSRIVARTRRGVATLAALGSDEERRRLADWLAAAWREARGAEAEVFAAREQPPSGWVAGLAEDGRPFLAADARPRRVGALVLGLVTLGLAAAGISIGGAAGGLAAWTGAAVFGALALLALAGTAWLALGRVELRPAERSLRRVRRVLGREWTREIQAARLRLESSRDSDGDERWRLVASGSGGELELASDLHAPGVARHMGLWLAARMHVELEGLPGGGSGERRAG